MIKRGCLGLSFLWALCSVVATTSSIASTQILAAPTVGSEIFYQVFVRSFRDSNRDRIGDLDGLRNGLDYIRGLGVTSILLTPVQPSPFYHNYFATDFDDIASEYGGQRAWLAFVRAAHQRGLKIYMDVEFQYVAGGHPWLEGGWHHPDSPYRHWLLWDAAEGHNAAEADPLASPFGLFAGAADGSRHAIAYVDLRQSDTRRYFQEYLLHWADPQGDGSGREGVDGYRIDHMMDDLDHQHVLTDLLATFWAPLMSAVKARRPSLRFLGEQADWGFGTDCLTAGTADSVFAFPLREALVTLDKSAILRAIEATEAATPKDKRQVLFLENHDTDRMMSMAGANSAKARAAAALLLMLKGDPSVYYGQELGMRGQKGPAEDTDAPDIPRREAFRWRADLEAEGSAIWYHDVDRVWSLRANRSNDGVSVQEEDSDPSSLLAWYRRLIHLRRGRSAIMRGSQTFPCARQSPVLCLLRTAGAERVLLLVNLSDAPATAEPDPRIAARDFRVVVGEGQLLDPLAPYAVRILETR